MKRTSIFAVLVMIIGTAAMAATGPLGENSRFKVLAKSDVKYELIYESDKAGDVKVYIYDMKGRNVSSTTVRNVAKFKRVFDFRNLDAGKYKVVVKNYEGIANEEIAHLVKKPKLQAFATVLPGEAAVKVHLGDYNAEKPVYVNIYDQNGKNIHRDKFERTGSFSRIYDLHRTDSQTVTVSIQNDKESKSFTHTIKQ